MLSHLWCLVFLQAFIFGLFFFNVCICMGIHVYEFHNTYYIHVYHLEGFLFWGYFHKMFVLFDLYGHLVLKLFVLVVLPVFFHEKALINFFYIKHIFEKSLHLSSLLIQKFFLAHLSRKLKGAFLITHFINLQNFVTSIEPQDQSLPITKHPFIMWNKNKGSCLFQRNELKK